MPNNLFIVNFITGISDGLILPLGACIIAYPHFTNDPWKRTAIGLTVAVMGGVAYGLARFFGEKEEIRHNHPQIASDEVEQETALMNAIGIDVTLTNEMQSQMEQERNMWLKEVEENEMGWERYDENRALKSGLQTTLGFLAGGLFMSLPFLLFTAKPYLLLVWVVACYLFFGRIKAYVTYTPWLRSSLAYLLKGMLTVVVSCLISYVVYKIMIPA